MMYDSPTSNESWFLTKVLMGKRPIRSGDLGIDLPSFREVELFKWFLACLLFGKPIQQGVARRTYFEFVKEGLLTPKVASPASGYALLH